MREALTLLAAASMACAGLKSYERAATQFGNSTVAGVAATRGVVGSTRETCRTRAWLHTVTDRFERPDFPRDADPLARPSGVARDDGKVLTWGELCARMDGYDAAVQNALGALETYASALRDVATSDQIAIDTGLTGALAADAGDLAQKLGGRGGARAQELAAPVTALVNVVLDLVKTRELKLAVQRGKQPVTVILDKVKEYLAAARLQLDDARSLSEGLVHDADRVLPVRKPGQAIPPELPGQVLALYEFARLERARVQSLGDQLASASLLVQDLAVAHGQLVKGAEAGIADSEVQSYVSKKMQDIVKQVNVLRNLSKG